VVRSQPWPPPYRKPINLHGLEFHVERHPNILLAHGYIGDRNSGNVFIVVQDGTDEDNLRARLEEYLTEITGHARAEWGEPDFVYLGHDPAKEPQPHDVANWPTPPLPST
jgi:hypothetical protein